MKILFLLVSLLSSAGLLAQSFTTKIKTAETVVTDASLKVGKITITNTAETRLHLVSVIEHKDAAGNYTTTYKFSPKTLLNSFPVNIAIQFDQEFSVKNIENDIDFFNILGQGSKAINSDYDMKKKIIYVQGKVNSNESAVIMYVKSKVPLKATVYGAVAAMP